MADVVEGVETAGGVDGLSFLVGGFFARYSFNEGSGSVSFFTFRFTSASITPCWNASPSTVGSPAAVLIATCFFQGSPPAMVISSFNIVDDHLLSKFSVVVLPFSEYQNGLASLDRLHCTWMHSSKSCAGELITHQIQVPFPVSNAPFPFSSLSLLRYQDLGCQNEFSVDFLLQNDYEEAIGN